MPRSQITRRDFISTTLAASLCAVSLPKSITAATPAATYTRHNVMSPGGQKALASYAKGIEAMLKLPAADPQNWFRNAFIHLMDCPHGNWWFYVWHRGYLGHFEQTIRKLSGDNTFALPYWDWTMFPQMPDPMFDGSLNPTGGNFEPYVRDLNTFTSFINPSLQSYWNKLNGDQRAQLSTRGYKAFGDMWNDVTGNGVPGNMAYATSAKARYITRANPKLDEKTAYNVSPFVVNSGLLPIDFYNTVGQFSFSSSKTPSHNSAPDANTVFSVLEGLPHNKVHNFIGGVGPWDPGPYGFMTNFLSPCDPSFFLHHANFDRLWDVWTRKQKSRNLPFGPSETDLPTYANEPFLFYVDGGGSHITNGKAGDYVDMARFEYDYEPGFGEDIVKPPTGLVAGPAIRSIKGVVAGDRVTIDVPSSAIARHLKSGAEASLIAHVTVPHPDPISGREFDVIVGAPADLTEIDAKSPYYAGTVSFFGTMAGMQGMAMESTFTVPLPKNAGLFKGFEKSTNTKVNIRILSTRKSGRKALPVKAVTLTVR